MNTEDGLATELEVARKELTAWRTGQEKGQRIPEPVWRTAVRAAKRHGVNPVSKALGLDYSCLKKRVGERGRSRRGAMTATPAFVEVLPDLASRDLACVIELEKGNGARLRICAKTANAVDWGKVREVFLGA